MREPSRPTHAQGLWATPPRHSSGHGEPGDGELGPLFPSPSAEAVFAPSSQTQKETLISLYLLQGVPRISGYSRTCVSQLQGEKKSQ